MQKSELELRIRLELERLKDHHISIREALTAIMELLAQYNQSYNGPG